MKELNEKEMSSNQTQTSLNNAEETDVVSVPSNNHYTSDKTKKQVTKNKNTTILEPRNFYKYNAFQEY